MDNQNEHLDHIKEIRSLMERSSKFLSLSGFSGIFAGLAAITGVAAAYMHFNLPISSENFYHLALTSSGEINQDFYQFIMIDILLVFASSLAVASVITIRKAKKQGQPIWDATAKRLMLNMFIPLLVGGIYCLLLAYHHQVEFIAPSSLIFYGLALLNASKYTVTSIRFLGLAQMVVGLIATIFLPYGVIFWAFGFGVLHIVYGIIVYLKYEM